eukprot:355096-Chlamydomonas_euryale.AAC.1
MQPAGMVVHISAGHHSGTLVNALLHHCGLPGEVGLKAAVIRRRLPRLMEHLPVCRSTPLPSSPHGTPSSVLSYAAAFCTSRNTSQCAVIRLTFRPGGAG